MAIGPESDGEGVQALLRSRVTQVRLCFIAGSRIAVGAVTSCSHALHPEVGRWSRHGVARKPLWRR
jgi:hypothetical protein